jgi:hypothetical protein
VTRTGLARVGAVVAIALVGVLIGRASNSVRDHDGAPAVPQRSKPTSRSAVVAAIEYLGALRWNVVVDDAERRRVIGARATADGRDELDRELAAAAAALRDAVAEPPVVARTTVLGYRVLSADVRRASVRVWGLALFGTGTYRPATQWSTSDVELLWSNDRWLVDGIENRGGPSPSFGTAALARRVAGLKEVSCVP